MLYSMSSLVGILIYIQNSIQLYNEDSLSHKHDISYRYPIVVEPQEAIWDV